jgi:hypothetical protein
VMQTEGEEEGKEHDFAFFPTQTSSVR